MKAFGDYRRYRVEANRQFLGYEIVTIMKNVAVIVCLTCVICLAGTVMGQDAVSADSPALSLLPSVTLRVDGVVDARGTVTLVTVHQKAAPPTDVFADLGKQAGVRFSAWPEGLWDRLAVKSLTLDADRQPFWVVALRAAEACGLSIRRVPASDGQAQVELHALRRGEAPPLTSVSGPLVVMAELTRPEHKDDLGNANAGLLLSLRVYADPSLKNFRFMDVPALEEATDEQGNSLLPSKPDKSTLPPSSELVSLHEVPLAYPVAGQPGKRIATLRGSMALLLSKDSEDVVINPAIKSVQARQVGKFTYSYQGLEKDAQGYELKLNVKGPADEMSVPVRDLMVSQQSILPTDAAGNRYRIGSIATTYSSKNIVGVGNAVYSVRLQPVKADAGDISTITWRLPKQISTQEVHFEFHDLPMP